MAHPRGAGAPGVGGSHGGRDVLLPARGRRSRATAAPRQGPGRRRPAGTWVRAVWAFRPLRAAALRDGLGARPSAWRCLGGGSAQAVTPFVRGSPKD